MCRLALKTASVPFSPYEVLEAMEAMQEGYDGSGLGLLLRGIEFSDFKYNPKFPILSGIAHSEKAWKRMTKFMDDRGYELKYDHRFAKNPKIKDTCNRYRYFIRAYRMPERFKNATVAEREEELLLTRIALRKDGESNNNDLTAFSFWPDVVSIKEVGWPLDIGNALSLHDGQIKSRICMAQGRQNTNYGINLYACHPFFIQGVATMVNGENTAFMPIKEWLIGREFPGYMGYQSDSEVFAHILHYTIKKLKLPLQAYKHIMTPLSPKDLAQHPQEDFLRGLGETTKRLVIDGPNAVIASLSDESCLLAMDQKKLRPAIIGGREGEWAIASELCGVAALVPDRDPALDFQPMREHTVIIPPDRKELKIWSQHDQLPLAV
ncbi:MAG: glutamate synthase [Desulfotalea sp.]